MNGDSVAVRGSGGGREVVVYVLWWGELDDDGAGKVTYGLYEVYRVERGYGLEEVLRKMCEIIGNDLTVRKLWHSLKYDRGMVMELEGDGDVRMFLKGNDEHGYLYRAKVMGRRGAHKRQRGPVIMASFVGEVAGIGMIWSKRVVREKVVAVSESGGCIDDHSQTTLRVSREIIEMSDDDEISVASEDRQKEEMKAAKLPKGGLYCNYRVLHFDVREYNMELTNSRKHMTWEQLMQRRGRRFVRMSLMMTMTAAYYPPPMGNSRVVQPHEVAMHSSPQFTNSFALCSY
ncbi:LOW QUALITY PROTEIN: hypothetical protein Cgig2_024409 [Carnegiea gigantea]|uniref:Uncharacterized protein n=1 Tax=Carnegiea gigantea TaxID=171969 RepID=A0A9Q1KLY8_9CARY|nr:LOW QUALITY PROTEIN: hypothetical protein Cgig2_024409 [Carnegiea gigantea]